MSENNQTETTSSQPAASPATEAAPQSAPAAAPSLEEQLAAARAEAAAAQDRYLRSVADLENFRKRTLREKDEIRQFGTANVMEDLIPILDNLGLGLAAAKQQENGDTKSIVEGIAMVLEQFKSTLGRHGLKEIDPIGQTFDPNLHDCISHLPSDQPEEKVIQVTRLGYSLNGRLLRPASVVVSSGPAKTEATT